jgi:hypothetical protein
MKPVFSSAALAACIAVLSHEARAQSVYIDFGKNPPSSSYAAAADAPGFWNSSAIPSSDSPLAGLSGETTALRLSTGGCFDRFFDFANTSGDDGALLDDWFFGDCPWDTEQIRVAHLSAGSYRLYVYTNGGGSGDVTVSVGLDPAGVIGGGGLFHLTSVAPFPGSFAGWTYIETIVHVPSPDSTLTLTYLGYAFMGLSGMQLVQFEAASETGTAYCFGDGSSVPCPCFNDGAWGRGCANLLYPGARLVASGTASVTADSLVLSASSMSGGFSWYFQATAQAADPWGYGILCVGGELIRVGQKALIDGASTNPSGGTRHYQVAYRQANPPCSPAPTTNTNSTNGLTIVWAP